MKTPYDPVHDIVAGSDEDDAEMHDALETQVQTTEDVFEDAAEANDEVEQAEEAEETEPENLEQLDQSYSPSSSAASKSPNNGATSQKKPVILRHKYSDNKLTPARKKHKTLAGPVNKSQTLFSSARSRHLKKNDGEPFWRRDIQYEFLKSLFDDDTKAFTDPYADSKDEIHMDDRTKDTVNNKLSFAELYIKTTAHSPKCSKVLKDRLLNDMSMSIPTCMICLLVNVGRMNTTINFVPDMKSQLRTYHSIPALQVNHSEKHIDNKNDKQLQDTPRLKSILKACCDEDEEPNGLPSLEIISDKVPKTNVINLIFILCNAEESVNKTFFDDTEYKFYDLFLNTKYNPHERAKLFLWLLFNYLETFLKEEDIAKNPFGAERIKLTEVEETQFDIDTKEELSFGKALLEQRVHFLKEDGVEEVADDKKSSPMKGKFKVKVKDEHHDSAAPSSVGASEISLHTTALDDTTENTESLPATAAPLLRQDIDVEKILKLVKRFKLQNYKKRKGKGLLKHEHLTIIKELQGPEDLTRLRLKNYKGDFAEFSSKMKQVFELLKQEYSEAVLNSSISTAECQYAYNEGDLSLREFRV
jgi:hypothetical protein